MTYPTREDRERLTHRDRNSLWIARLFGAVIVGLFILGALLWAAE